jgi:o-succinylbenzoate---CoA ligase
MELIHDGGLLPDWLRRRALSAPGRIAIIADGHQLTFADLDRRTDDVATYLARLGVAAGDRIAVLLQNGVQFVETVHAMPRIGAMIVPVNLRLTAAEIAWQLDDAGAALLVTDRATDDLTRAIDERCPGLTIVPPLVTGEHDDTSTVGQREGLALIEHHDASEIHSIVYTSGTTGRPKGAMLTFGNHLWSAIGSALNLGVTPSDRWLVVLPLFHVGGLSILFRSVLYGIPVVIHESFNPAAVNRSIDEDRVTIVSVVATMLSRMLDERGERPYPAWLRCVLLGGGPAPRPLLEACAARDVPVTQTYGLTETASQVATLAPEDALRRLGSAGVPLYPNEVSIESDGRRAQSGEPGEILVRGPIVTAGYHRLPDATASALIDGWLHTGDYGFLDESGFLYVLDRRDDLIVTGGENVYPAEVEAALLSHSAVEEAAVIGEPDPEWGQRVVAIVRATREIGPNELQAYCRASLASYKVPAVIRFRTEPLPRTAAGKLIRRELRER